MEPSSLKAEIKHRSSGSLKVGQETQIEFTIKTTNPIPIGGGVKIEMPKWNTKAPAPISYITNNDEASLCESLGGLPAPSCGFFGSTTTDTIMVNDMFTKA